MAKWTIDVLVTAAEGVQHWEVEADSAAEARAAYLRGEGEVVAEEIEVIASRVTNVRPAEE